MQECVGELEEEIRGYDEEGRESRRKKGRKSRRKKGREAHMNELSSIIYRSY